MYIPLIKTISAHRMSSSFSSVTAMSITFLEKLFGSIAASVSRPSGGRIDFLERNGSVCLRFQNVSGHCGYTSNMFILEIRLIQTLGEFIPVT